MKPDYHPTPYTKLNWIKDLNIRPETIKLGENIGDKLVDVSLGHDLKKNSNTQSKSNKSKKSKN